MIPVLMAALSAAAIAVQSPSLHSPVDSVREEVATLLSQVAAQRRETTKVIQESVERATRTDARLTEIASALKASRNLAILDSEQSQSRLIGVNGRLDRIEDRQQLLLGFSISTLVVVLAGTAAVVMRRRQVDDLENAREAEARTTVSAPVELTSASSSVVMPQVDHGLAIRVGDEMHRIRNRLSQLPETGTTTKSLRRSVDRIEESLNEAGYSIPDLAGKTYHDGMTLAAHFIVDETLVPDARVIGRVIRPQINFRDVLIQPAEVEVRTGIPLQTSPSLIS